NWCGALVLRKPGSAGLPLGEVDVGGRDVGFVDAADEERVAEPVLRVAVFEGLAAPDLRVPLVAPAGPSLRGHGGEVGLEHQAVQVRQDLVPSFDGAPHMQRDLRVHPGLDHVADEAVLGGLVAVDGESGAVAPELDPSQQQLGRGLRALEPADVVASPALREMALAPRMPSHDETLSPDHVEHAYRIVPAVADRVRTNGRSLGKTSNKASCEHFPWSSVCIALPQRPMSFLVRFAESAVLPSATAECSSASSHLSDGTTYSLLSFHMQSIPVFRNSLTPLYQNAYPASEVKSMCPPSPLVPPPELQSLATPDFPVLGSVKNAPLASS
ncbi:hypothetical protein Tdes44962_MAKER09464, partial [Teratosphaeria destructans]